MSYVVGRKNYTFSHNCNIGLAMHKFYARSIISSLVSQCIWAMPIGFISKYVIFRGKAEMFTLEGQNRSLYMETGCQVHSGAQEKDPRSHAKHIGSFK